MKKIATLCLLLSVLLVEAQDTETQPNQKKTCKSDLSLKATVKNRHLWRCGVGINGFSVQSQLTYSYSSVRVGAWGAYELAPKSYGEVDLFVEADILDYFTVGLYDFYAPKEYGGRIQKDFSDFKSSPSHLVDFFVKYSGTEDLPIGAVVGTYLYGKGDQDNNGDQKFSTYIELNYNLKIRDKGDLKFYIGSTTSNESAYAAKEIIFDSKGNINMYRPATDSDFNIIGLGSAYTRHLKIGKFATDVSGEFLYNPNVDAVYMALATSINL